MRMFRSALLFCCLFSGFAQAAPALRATDIAGIWTAKLALEDATYTAEIRIKSDGTYSLRDNAKSETPATPGCTGTYTLVDSVFTGTLRCENSTLSQRIDFRRADKSRFPRGLIAPIFSSPLGERPLPFQLTKTDRPYFAQPLPPALLTAACGEEWETQQSCQSVPAAGDQEAVSRLFDAISICTKGEKTALALRAGNQTQIARVSSLALGASGNTYKLKEQKLEFSLNAGAASLVLQVGRERYSSTYRCEKQK